MINELFPIVFNEPTLLGIGIVVVIINIIYWSNEFIGYLKKRVKNE